MNYVIVLHLARFPHRHNRSLRKARSLPNAEFVLAPRLHGSRFAGGEIPAEFLVDIAELSKMVAAVAEWRYNVEHPKKKVPKGFREAVSLSLVRIGETASAVPVLHQPKIGMLDSFDTEMPYQRFLLEAQAYIAEAIHESEVGQPEGNRLPNRFLDHFKKIGKNLDGESFIELTHPTAPYKAKITAVSRRKLLDRAKTPDQTAEMSLRGTVPEVDLENGHFQLKQVFGRKLSQAPLSDKFERVVVEALNGYHDNRRVRVDGVCSIDDSSSPIRFNSVDDVIPLDPLDVQARLDEFKQMKKMGYPEAERPTLEELNWLSQSFSEHYPSHLSLPHMFPVEGGRIEMEWEHFSLEINLSKRQGAWFDFSTATDQEPTMLNFDSPSSWGFVSKQLLSQSSK